MRDEHEHKEDQRETEPDGVRHGNHQEGKGAQLAPLEEGRKEGDGQRGHTDDAARAPGLLGEVAARRV